MDVTNFSQTMDIDVDFDGNQSYQPTKMLSMFVNNQHTFNFEDTEVTFEFTRYIQQLCHEMEEAKNRIECGDSEIVKNLLKNLIDKVQQDISMVNQSLNNTLSNTVLNATSTDSTISNLTTPTNTLQNTTIPKKANETSILGLLHDLFVEKEEKSPIQTISKLNILSRSLKDVSATLSNLSMNNTTVNDRSILKSIKEENSENKENSKNETFQEPSNETIAEATFINQSVCNPLMELIAAVEKKIDIEKVEEQLKAKYEEQLNAKDILIIKLEQDLSDFKEALKTRTSDHENAIEQLERAKKENEVLDEIISDEKRKLQEKQSTIEELNIQLSQNMAEFSKMEEKNIELTEEVNRLSVVKKQNQSLIEQVNDLMKKTDKMFELEKKLTLLSVKCNEKQSQIENISYELKTNQDLNERISKERIDLMHRLDFVIKNDSDKELMINELNIKISNLSAQLSLQNDKCDFLNAKLKETSTLKNQLDKDRKDVCWQINELLKNPDIDFDDLKTFLVRVEEKINNVNTMKPKGAAFVKSLAIGTLKEASKI